MAGMLVRSRESGSWDRGTWVLEDYFPYIVVEAFDKRIALLAMSDKPIIYGYYLLNQSQDVNIR